MWIWRLTITLLNLLEILLFWRSRDAFPGERSGEGGIYDFVVCVFIGGGISLYFILASGGFFVLGKLIFCCCGGCCAFGYTALGLRRNGGA